MSNYLAIATVTAVLQHILQEVVVSLATATVTTSDLRPPSAAPGSTGVPTVNLFLYQVLPNPALRNADLPTRRAGGGVVQRPQAALDLRYLLSFYGDNSQLVPQRLLGKVIAALHARPVITRKAIESTPASSSTYSFLAKSDLAQSVECVRLTPYPLSLEEASRLWAMFPQTAYALSIAYTASVVLIEEEEVPEPALPVRDFRVYAVPFRRPVIHSVTAATAPHNLILPNSTLVIRGENLMGEATFIRLAGVEIPVQKGQADVLELNLTQLPKEAVLRAGVQGLQVVHQQSMGDPLTLHSGVSSNLTAFVVHSTIAFVPPPTVTGAPFELPDIATSKLSLKIEPPLRAGQRAALLLSGTAGSPPGAVRVDLPPESTDQKSLTFTVPRPPVGRYLVHVEVDGAESALSYDATLPGFNGPVAVRLPKLNGNISYRNKAIRVPLDEDVWPGMEVHAELFQQSSDKKPAHVLAANVLAKPTPNMTFSTAAVPAGTYWVRIVINGATSKYQGPQNAPTGPKVTIS